MEKGEPLDVHPTVERGGQSVTYSNKCARLESVTAMWHLLEREAVSTRAIIHEVGRISSLRIKTLLFSSDIEN